MKPAGKILSKVRSGVQTIAYNNILYRKILATGDGPDRLHFTLADTWPGDAQEGLALLSGQRSMFDNGAGISLRQTGTVLRNLRAVGTDAARHMAVGLIASWLGAHDGWSEDEWAPDALGERIAAWISTYEFYAPVAPPRFIADLTGSLQRQWRHLTRVVPPTLTSIAGLRAIKGLIYGGLNFPDADKALGLALDLLRRQLSYEVLPDGGSISRNPSTQLHMLRHLVELRTVFRAAGIEAPDCVQTAIAAMAPAVRFYRHGDGGLALFHGGIEETSLLVDAVLNQAEVKGRALRRLPDTGYERITAGRAYLLADCAPPPPRGYDAAGHAGLLSFEFGSGKERLIVNCGAVTGAGPEWRSACAATAAHSTLTVEDKNACEVMSSGSVIAALNAFGQRYEQDGNHFIEMSHDGYRARFGLTHHRVLKLATSGEELFGCDALEGPAQSRDFALRFHLHPSVQASLAQNGRTVLLRTPSGSGWRLRAETDQGEACEMHVEPSVYCGSGAPRRSLQIRISGRTYNGAQAARTSLNWAIAREKKN